MAPARLPVPRSRPKGYKMKLTKYQVPPKVRGGDFDLTVPSGASWVRFGNDVLIYGEEAQWKGLINRAREARLQKQEHVSTVKKERMHIVVQNGRLFQQEHPKVPVILDRGRFLLVDLDPARVRGMRRKSLTCYGVLPLGNHKVVFDVQKRAGAQRARVTKYPARPFKGYLHVWSHSRPDSRPAPTMPALPPRRAIN